MYKAEIGRIVRDRLSNTPNVVKVPSPQLDLFVARNFLTQEECDKLIAIIDTNRQPSGVLGPDMDPEYRTSESCNVNPFDPFIKQIEDKIAALMPIDRSHGETIQGQRYAVGQQFKPHHDFFYTDQPYWPEQERTGGQRTWTVMMFLNEPEAGGHTAFPEAGVKITPKTGNLLAWNNLTPAGYPNSYSLHTGTPVVEGVKYVITKWYRERPWGYSSGDPMAFAAKR